jgi:hypothetical protein
VSFFERELQTLQPVPQAPDANFDLALDRKPPLEFFERCIWMGGHLRAQCFIMGCKLRFAPGPAGARGRLAGRLPAAKRFVDVGNADPKQWRRSIRPRPTIHRSHHAFTQVLRIRLPHRDLRVDSTRH